MYCSVNVSEGVSGADGAGAVPGALAVSGEVGV